MKTVRSILLSVSVLLISFVPVSASSVLLAEADGRYRFSADEHEVFLNGAGVLMRSTFADSRGDRLTVFALGEVMKNAEDAMLHEGYLKYKGPLGAWNITAGRFTLQHGLLWNFTAKRLLFEDTGHMLLGFDADNGLMVSGITEELDYSLSVTQGLGPHGGLEFPGPGLFSGRVGFPLGMTGQNMLGLSLVFGRTDGGYRSFSTDLKRLALVDGLFDFDRFILRFEVTGGRVEDDLFSIIFSNLDMALFPRLDLNIAGTGVEKGGSGKESLFAGLTFKPKFLTIRGGYTHVFDENEADRFSIQLYRLFSTRF
ncbi:MAG: hypothetical protein ACLFQK_00360 [Fibrobacterota bacterium]